MRQLRAAGSRIEGVRRIAVLRAAGLGDLMFSLPALAGLRATYPEAELVLLGNPGHAELLAGRGVVDRVLVVPDVPEQWRSSRRAPTSLMTRVLATLREERFDVALQLYGGGRESNVFLNALGAGVTAGWRAEGAERLDREVPYRYYQHEVLRCLEAAAVVGAPPVALEPELPVIDDDLIAAGATCPAGSAGAARPAGRASPREPLAVLHPGAGDLRRRWPPERFAVVADALAAAGARVLLVGAEADRVLGERISAAAESRPEVVAGRMSLPALVGLLARAAVYVGNDSGPLHIAAAVGAPTVGIYWCGNLVTAGPLTRSRHRPLVSWRLDCPRCGRDCTRHDCGHSVSFVAEVTAEEVRAEAVALLSPLDASAPRCGNRPRAGAPGPGRQGRGHRA